MLTSRPSAKLEYWFFKLNAPKVALLVDWIVRRAAGTRDLRISIHSPAGREVLFAPDPPDVSNGPPDLASRHTRWADGPVRWDLALTPASPVIRPQIFPLEQLGVFDMSLVSLPDITFEGRIEHRGQQFEIRADKGMASHYWGRGLPREWWWISANQFPEADIAVECTFLRSHLWGSSFGVSLGYFFFRNGPVARQVISPPARLAVTGSPDYFEVTVSDPSGFRARLKCAGREYGDLGDGIVNTLVGDLDLWEGEKLLARARGTAALERRASSS